MERWSVGLALILSFLPGSRGWAQPATPPDGTSPATSRPAVGTNRDGASRMRLSPDALLGDMKTQLGLDPTQQEKSQKLLDAYQEKMQSLRASYAESAEFRAKMTNIQERMQAARLSQDHDQMVRLSEEVRAIRREQDERLMPFRKQMAQTQEELYRGLRGVLREDQLARFDMIWEDQITFSMPYGGPRRTPQALRALVRRLPNLGDDQKSQIDQFFEQYLTSSRGATGEAAKLLEKKLFDDVLGQLTPEQRARIERQLAGRDRPGGPPAPGDGPAGDAPQPFAP
jgi:hypothetical protein